MLSFFVIHDYPTTASFLTERERAWSYHRLKYQNCEHTGRLVAENETFQWKYVVQVVTDWQLLVNLFVYWGTVGPLYGMSGITIHASSTLTDKPIGISLFLPTIIQELGYSSSTAQLLTIPIYVSAAVIAVLVCWLSDRAAKAGRSRSKYIIGCMIAIITGYVLAIAGSAGHVPGVVYAGELITQVDTVM